MIKNELILKRDKEILIDKIKQIRKEDVVPKQPEPTKKLTLWQRIKVLMG
jgi:2-phosphoglycerate kinase